LEEQLYLVDELIPAAGLVIIWGKPKCFKSFLALDIMFHVVQGWEWHDRAVRQGSAIYCAFEGAHGYRKRIAALLSHYGLDYDDNAPLHVIAGNANLIADHRILIRDIKSQLGDEKINAIVLDTLNKSLHGSESKDVDMANYIRAAEALRDTFNCVVVIVHHCGYDETRPRGHSSLPGAVDVQAAVTRDGALVTMEIEYMRDGPEGTIVTGEAKSIEVGVDSNGKPLTSLVIVPIDKPPEVPRRKDWPRSLAVFRDALSEAILAHGQDFQVNGGPKVKAVAVEYVREVFYKIYVAEGDDPEQARRRAFVRCLKHAQESHFVGARILPDGRQLIWPAVSHYGEI
jgi:hypothetical protein